jgi:type VI secretion system protein ImpI/type VI secretion system protein
MELVLSVLRCPDSTAPGTRRVTGSDFTLGRAEGCDWVLADPDRLLSKRHCSLEYRAGGWQLRDLSTNGTYVNAAAAPVGRDATTPLQDGDRLRIGPYEIEVRVEGEMAAGWPARHDALGSHRGPDPLDDPFAGLGAPPLPGAGSSPDPGFGAGMEGMGLPPLGTPSAPAGSAPGFSSNSPFAPLPMDFDPLGSPPGLGSPREQGPVWSDHTPAASDAFVPPRAAFGAELPADWDSAPPAPPPAFPQGEPNWDDLLGDLSPPGGTPASGAGNPFAPPPAKREAPSPGLPGEDPFSPGPAPPAIPAPPAGTPRPTSRDTGMRAEKEADGPFAESPAFAAAAEAAWVPPSPRPAEAVAAAPSVAPLDAAAGLEALLRGAGLSPLPPGTDPVAALHAAGAALRAAVSGLRALLIARADVKRAFRIEQTMLSRRDNNPVKFAATDEASLTALLSGGAARGPAALEETVGDLTLHQVATLAATQAAARALLDRLAPAEVEGATPGGGILPGQREKRLWEGYRTLHAKLTEQFEDDFDSAFGRAFARAYETAARKAGRAVSD